MATKKKKGPGKSYRNGVSLEELFDKFPTEEAAENWFIKARWVNDIYCPKCGSLDIKEKAHRKNRKLKEWRCRDCVKDFTVKTNNIMHNSNLPLRKWAIATYLFITDIHGVSSMRLHRELKIKQNHAWHMLHRLREALTDSHLPFLGPVEADETSVGGKEKFKHKKNKLNKGRGSVGKATIIAVKDRKTNHIHAEAVPSREKVVVHRFVKENVSKGAKLFTDEHKSYGGLESDYHHEKVRHKTGEYVRFGEIDLIHTNGVESFWTKFNRGYHGTYYKMSVKHLDRYAKEFAGRHNLRELDTDEQLTSVVRSMEGKTLPYKELVGKAA